MTAPTTTPDTERQERTDNGDNLCHLMLCHNEDVAYCGVDLMGAPLRPNAPAAEVCIVCRDLARTHCGCACGCCEGCQVPA